MYTMLRQPTLAAWVVTITLIALPQVVSGQQALEDWEQQELRPLVEAVSSALEGELVQTDDPFEVLPDFLKGTEGSTYVPFRLTIDPSKVNQSTVLMYLLVTPHADPAAADPDAEPVTADEVFDNATFEDAFFIDVSASRAAGGPVELQRSFSAPGGTYDMYIVVRDSVGEDGDEDELENSMIMMVRQQVEVPDFWNDQLQTSSIIVASVVEPLEQPLTQAEQIASPYSLGGTRITPKNGTDFGKDEELALIMLVYNPQLTDGQKPDLTIEYDFNQVTEAGEEFFNRTSPQEFNPQTLPPEFDVSAGHQIVAGQSVPLASFPAGGYRLEIKVTDNSSGEELLRELNFTVAE